MDTGRADHPYAVERADGDWLWLTSGAIGGWAKAADLIPLDRAIPKSVVALVSRGNAWQAKGDFDRAIADYDEAIQFDPRNILAHMNRGIARQAEGNSDEAIADYDEAIRRGLKAAQAYNNRGHARERKKDYDKAIADYTEAIRLRPGYILSWLNRGNARKAKGQFEEALADYESATRLDPKSPWGYALQASLLAASPEAKYRDGPRAVELASKACELGGASDAYLCAVRAAAHAAAGESDRANEWQARAREAVSKAPGGHPVAQRAKLKPYQGELPSARTPIGSSGSPPTGIMMGSSSGANLSGYVVPNPSGNTLPSESQTNSFYGANYVLPQTGAFTVGLPRSGGTNVGYTSSVPTYYGGNVPNSSGHYPVNSVDPAYYGANYSGKSLTTPGSFPGGSSANSMNKSYYGANYSGTAIFNPGYTSGFFPNNPTGTSYYGADYSGTMVFTPGSPPSSASTSSGFATNPP